MGHTCWFMSRMAISFRSFVKLSKACSICDVSVLESTMRKLRWDEGGSVTCYYTRPQLHHFLEFRKALRGAYANSSEEKPGYRVLDRC
jgi:hypothetical protein